MKILKKQIFITGPPRSGTTWIANVLSSSGNTDYIHEPDNEKNNFLAFLYKINLPRFPYIRENEDNKEYKKLFQKALLGNFIKSGTYYNQFLLKINRLNKDRIEAMLNNNKHQNKILLKTSIELITIKDLLTINNKKQKIIKSVHALLSIPFIMRNFDILPLFIVRHPLSVISSYIKLQIHDANRSIYKNQKIKEDFLLPYQKQINEMKTNLELNALQISIFHHIISKYIKRYNYNFVKHEDMCLNPLDKFKMLFKKTGIQWSISTENFIKKHNQSGVSGYDIYRSTRKLADNKKLQFSKDEINQIRKGYSILPNDFGYLF